MKENELLPLPPHFDPNLVAQVWRVPYQERAEQARAWAGKFEIEPANLDRIKINLVCVDVQNTFCIPGFELYVAGRSGTGAVDDNRRLCQFIYQNLGKISQITPTMDTHQAIQIFHAIFLIDERGNHPGPHRSISIQDIRKGRWKFNPVVAESLGITQQYGQQHLEHYAAELAASRKYELTIWPYHAMLGGIGHALVSSVEEAIFFHGMARACQPDFQVKGRNPLTEHYSVLGPEVLTGPGGEQIDQKNEHFLRKLREFDALVIAGQAKSHCVAWTIEDLLELAKSDEPKLLEKVYLLEDCTSPVVVPGVADFSQEADRAFARFAGAGMHLVRSSDAIENWPGMASLSLS